MFSCLRQKFGKNLGQVIWVKEVKHFVGGGLALVGSEFSTQLF